MTRRNRASGDVDALGGHANFRVVGRELASGANGLGVEGGQAERGEQAQQGERAETAECSHGAPFGVVAHPPTRQRGARLTSRLDDVWPQVEPRLRRVAAARGIPVDDRDDIVQEVAVRVLASGVTFETAEELLPWAATVLRRIHVDGHRKRERIEFLPLTSATADSTSTGTGTGDVADAAVAWLDLATIGQAVAAWPPDARHALFGRDRHTGASYVRRHRLRARLLELIDGLAAWVGG